MITLTRPQRLSLPFLFCALVAALIFSGAAPAEELRGQIQILKKGGKGVCRNCDLTKAVVYFEPAAGTQEEVVAGSFELRMARKSFDPRVLSIPLGSTVTFPNLDPILHNAFSVSKGNAFDLGIYRGDTVKEKTFETPGVVRVHCNVHPTMVAYLVVLDTPFVISPAADGTFVLADLPAAPGRLTVWHDRIKPYTLDLRLPAEGPIEIEVETEGSRIPAHLNKFGKRYPRSRSGKY
jgi:plastocyanin